MFYCLTYLKGNCRGCEEEHREGDCYSRGCVKKRGISCCGTCGEFPCDTILSQSRTILLDKAWLLWKKGEI
ncbi:MAG: DUF3795 domain-containing protein [Lachnospiraceae bacterium]|nr:DUF3795 domain-containing protein [Lachnospiraceae bacterium]